MMSYKIIIKSSGASRVRLYKTRKTFEAGVRRWVGNYPESEMEGYWRCLGSWRLVIVVRPKYVLANEEFTDLTVDELLALCGQPPFALFSGEGELPSK
jgi:hypothetical protein